MIPTLTSTPAATFPATPRAIGGADQSESRRTSGSMKYMRLCQGTYVRRLSTPPLVDIRLPIGQEALERHDKVRTAGGEVGPFARVDAQVEEQ
jgi:hypothetical protein